MRSYSIIQVKEEYVPFVCGKETSFHELLNETEDLQNDLPIQCHYLCEKLNFTNNIDSITNHLQTVYQEVYVDLPTIIVRHSVKGEAKLVLSDYVMNVQCKGNPMLDLDIFSILSRLSGAFFALQKSSTVYGWLKPMKHFV